MPGLSSSIAVANAHTLLSAPAVTPALSVSTAATGTLAAVVLAALVWYIATHKGAKWLHMFIAVCLGVTIANSAIGGDLSNFVASGAGMISGLVSSV
jgi:CDP-diglyceride synthetase